MKFCSRPLTTRAKQSVRRFRSGLPVDADLVLASDVDLDYDGVTYVLALVRPDKVRIVESNADEDVVVAMLLMARARTAVDRHSDSFLHGGKELPGPARRRAVAAMRKAVRRLKRDRVSFVLVWHATRLREVHVAHAWFLEAEEVERYLRDMAVDEIDVVCERR